MKFLFSLNLESGSSRTKIFCVISMFVTVSKAVSILESLVIE